MEEDLSRPLNAVEKITLRVMLEEEYYLESF